MLLDQINSPQDLKKIPVTELPVLCAQIRQKIIEVVSKTGGHLASSLGAVELAVALHYCLNTPRDILIWDVGHQAYAHKILTGRLKNFHTLRQFGGISGFPSKDESEYDHFTCGHSSTAVSLALGMAVARDLKGTTEKIVSVIGDGSLTGGLCFEALNNAGHIKKDIIVILNSNEMSISPSVGSLTTYLNRIISQPVYNRFRAALENFIKTRVKGFSMRVLKLAAKFEEVLKGLIVPGIFFEELGFRYFGPLDGHNVETLVNTLRNILNLKEREPILLHVITKKGKGYVPAEVSPVKFHSAIPFEIETGDSKSVSVQQRGGRYLKSQTYTDVFSDKLMELAAADKRIVAITAAMPEGTGLDKFRDKYGERFFDVGIAEQHAISFASGLSKNGFRPVVAIYSTFLQRGYDQIIEEVALQKLPIILAIDRAGIVGEDGVTHQGIFDIAYLRSIPGLTIMAPKDAEEFKQMLEFAVNFNGPIAIRYPKAKVAEVNWPAGHQNVELARAEILKEGNEIAVIAIGTMVQQCLEAVNILAEEKIKATLVNSRFVKPLDKDLIRRLCAQFKFIFCVEEGIREGGFGSAVTEASLDFESSPKIRILGLPDEFIVHGPREFLLDKLGLSAQKIAQKIKETIS